MIGRFAGNGPAVDYVFDNINVLIGERNFEIRKAMRSLLIQNGFKQIIDVNNAKEVRHHARMFHPDLLIVDFDLPEDDICEIIRDIRQEKLGNDPFVPVILTVSEINSDNAPRILETGVDHVLRRPVSTADLLGRVRDLVENRKPFAVTQTYVGPDRRSKERSDPKKDKLIEVPNVIGAKAKNDAEALSLVAHKTKVAMTAIKTLKVERYGVTILMKIYDLLSRIDAGQNDEARQLADEIVVLLAEISSRLSTTKFKDIVPVFKGLSTALKELKAKSDLTKQDAKRLEPLSRKVAEVFGGLS